jgi:large subunit ribosomal protein L6
MSRIGKQEIGIPENVNVVVSTKTNLDGQAIFIEGPKGRLYRILHSLIYCNFDETSKKLVITRVKDTKQSQELCGLSRTLVANMVTGVSIGFEKRLNIVGVGYRAQLDGKNLSINAGYSHSVKRITPNVLAVVVESPTSVVVSGIQKDVVGEFAAKLRAVRPSEPYKGKGIFYEGEFIKRKAGKTRK